MEIESGSFMHEKVARDVVLVRAIESADTERRILSDDYLVHAGRLAYEQVLSEAAKQKPADLPAMLLEKRAAGILRNVAERHPLLTAAITTPSWERVFATGLPLAAFAAGVLLDRITDPHRVDLLSAPLLAIVLWNVLVYAAMLVWLAMPGRAGQALFGMRLPRRLLHGHTGVPRKLAPVLVSALAGFSRQWTELSAALSIARAARTMHLSAACFALGAVVSLYGRGILAQYRAGWESTFLDAPQVHAILSLLFMPARAVFGLPGFSIADVQALQFAQPQMPPLPASGALWVHLYAGTLLLLVVLPRLLLWFAARCKVSGLVRNFPLNLEQAYFRKLTQVFSPAAPAVLRVFPYSFTIGETRSANLAVVARMLLGDRARVMLHRSTAYGEDLPDTTGEGHKDGVGQTVALFNLSATPEKENHGAFLDRLPRGGTREASVLIDESAWLERAGTQVGGEARLKERVALWRQFCELHGAACCIVNLLDPGARGRDIT